MMADPMTRSASADYSVTGASSPHLPEYLGQTLLILSASVCSLRSFAPAPSHVSEFSPASDIQAANLNPSEVPDRNHSFYNNHYFLFCFLARSNCFTSNFVSKVVYFFPHVMERSNKNIGLF